jgi:predicted ABC-type ATPase
MGGQESRLSDLEHARIFEEKVLAEADLASKTSLEHPKVIILAGQPGAGKGGLTQAARFELKNDVIVVDPDSLRDAHPRVGEFRSAHPYTWADDTHPDASAWAKELRAAAIDGRKNLILDTTLGDGDKAVALVNELKAKGYDVEIRAVAANRLESELGVDERFAKKIDLDGYGRYVPEGIRDQVYRDLPDNLNQVAKETGTPIRIFNREGAELYDSRTDTRLPGAALEEARDARLKDPGITRDLRDGWKEQQTWHRDLPENLPNNAKVDPATRENLLAERSTNHVAESVDRTAREAIEVDHVTRVHPTRVRAGAALGVAGLALEIYDGAPRVA